MSWTITDEDLYINVQEGSASLATLPKEKVVLVISLAGEGENESGVDELHIKYAGKYTTKIPYDDVTIGVSSASSVEDFRTQVLAYLNDLPAGGGPESDPNAIWGDGTQPPTDHISWDGFKIVDLADGTSGDDAVNLGQMQAAIDGLLVEYAVSISQDSTSPPVVNAEIKNTTGLSFSWEYINVGIYSITADSAVFTNGNWIAHCNYPTDPTGNAAVVLYQSTTELRLYTYQAAALTDGVLANNLFHLRIFI